MEADIPADVNLIREKRNRIDALVSDILSAGIYSGAISGYLFLSCLIRPKTCLVVSLKRNTLEMIIGFRVEILLIVEILASSALVVFLANVIIFLLYF